jgi:hypothetical protein
MNTHMSQVDVLVTVVIGPADRPVRQRIPYQPVEKNFLYRSVWAFLIFCMIFIKKLIKKVFFFRKLNALYCCRTPLLCGNMYQTILLGQRSSYIYVSLMGFWSITSILKRRMVDNILLWSQNISIFSVGIKLNTRVLPHGDDEEVFWPSPLGEHGHKL